MRSNLRNKHKDKYLGMKNIEQLDDIFSINRINNWEIKVTLAPKERCQRITPEW